MGEVYDVGTPVTQHAVTIEEESSPVEWMQKTTVWFYSSRSAPKIPVERLGLSLTSRKFFDTSILVHEEKAR